MSIIATKVYPNKIIIGADSALTTLTNMQTNEEEAKLCCVKGVVVGFTGISEHFTLFRYFLETVEADLTKVETFVDVMELYMGFCAMTKELDVPIRGTDESGFTGPADNIHLVINKRAWNIMGYNITEITDYDAIGSGTQYALSLLDEGFTVAAAIRGAARRDIYCNLPAYIYTVPKGSGEITIQKEE